MPLFDDLFDSDFDKEGIFDDDLFDDALFTLDEMIMSVMNETQVSYGRLIQQAQYEQYRRNEEEELILLMAGYLA